MWRSRWAAIGAAIAVTLGAGGVSLVSAGVDTGERPVTVTVEPERILDTRVDLGLTGRFVTDTPRRLQVTGEVPVASGGTRTVVPDDAVAVLVNVTVVEPDGPGFLTLRPDGDERPTTSTVNFLPGAIEPNAATVDLLDDGTIQVWFFASVPGGTGDVLVDVVGYTVDHTHDDRYYTEAEVDDLLAEIPAGPAGPTGPAGPDGPAGPPGPAGAAGSYEHVIVVAEDGGDFTSVVDAMAAIGTDPAYPAASSTERYLVWVAPGTYDGQVVMQPYVDIEGAGQGITTLSATRGAGGISPVAATVVGSDDAELRSLTVEVTAAAPGSWSHAFYTSGVTTLREVTLIATGGFAARGVMAAAGGAPLLTDVVVVVSGASDSNIGLDITQSTAFGDGVFVRATGGLFARGVLVSNATSEVGLENITTIVADGVNETVGLQLAGSSASIEGYRATVTSTSGDLVGARCAGASEFLKVLDGTVFASNSGGQARGVFGSDCSLELRDMVIDAISEGAAPAQGIDHFQGNTTITADLAIADVEIRAESTGGNSFGIQLNGNSNGAGSFGEVRDATIRSISGSPAASNHGIRHNAVGQVRYRTTAITVRGAALFGYGAQTTGGGRPVFDDIVIDTELAAEGTAVGIEVATDGTVVSNVRARVVNVGSGSGHDAVGLKSNAADDVVFRDASSFAQAENGTWGVDLATGSARLERIDARAVSTVGGTSYGVRCSGGRHDVTDSNAAASAPSTAYGYAAFNCSGTIADSGVFADPAGTTAVGLRISNASIPGEWVVRGGELAGKISIASTHDSTVDVIGADLSGAAGVASAPSVQTCVGVTYDSGGAPAFDAGPTSPCP